MSVKSLQRYSRDGFTEMPVCVESSATSSIFEVAFSLHSSNGMRVPASFLSRFEVGFTESE